MDAKKFNEIAEKWQKKWEENKVFNVKEDKNRKKYYVLEMFPYPSGKMHMGHVRNYTIGDTYARYKRMRGFNVLHPIGYDAFGLPAENAAIKNNIDPKEWTLNNIDSIKKQLKQFGYSYDWLREVITCMPDYYKFNQWLFVEMYKKGLVYRKKSLVNWCPKCKTVLANEQVKDNRCWRCGTEIEQKELEQWFFKITDYSEELLNKLDELDWPERAKIMQKNWIGKSHGVMVNFKIKDSDEILTIFTTRPDTIYGVTFMVVAPEYPKLMEWVKGTKYEKDVIDFINKVKKQTIKYRLEEDKEKEGVFTGKYVINPLNNDVVPVYVGNFVLPEYGTGAIMAVPAHDQRDFEFAKKYNIPIKVVIQPQSYELNPEKMSRAYIDEGILVNSDKFNGTNSSDAIQEISKYIEEKGYGKITVQYKLKDWLISRQRYWGTPIPIIYCKKCGIVPVPEDQLPVKLPDSKDVDFQQGKNPLLTSEKFVKTKCPICGRPAERETDTMDTFVDSSWYFLKYCSPGKEKIFDKNKVKYWMPVDVYIGGIEHAVMHLLYARFITKVMRDIGLLDIDEPFKKMVFQGMVIKDGAKMSKSLGNIVEPKEMIEKYGIDTVRLFILFAASVEKELDWKQEGIDGVYRFIRRIYSLMEKPENIHKEENKSDKWILRKLNKTIRDVTEQIESFKLNLAIGTLMEFINDIYRYKEFGVNIETYNNILKNLSLIINPFIPHVSEEIWHKFDKNFSSIQKWPEYDESMIDEKLDYEEEFIQNTRIDIIHIINLINKKDIKKIELIVPSEWKYKLFSIIKGMITKTRDFNEIIKEIMKNDEMKKHSKEIIAILQKVLKDESKIPMFVLDQKQEMNIINESKELLEKEFKTEIIITKEEESKNNKARQSLPGKLAIVVE